MYGAESETTAWRTLRGLLSREGLGEVKFLDPSRRLGRAPSGGQLPLRVSLRPSNFDCFPGVSQLLEARGGTASARKPALGSRSLLLSELNLSFYQSKPPRDVIGLRYRT